MITHIIPPILFLSFFSLALIGFVETDNYVDL